MGGMTCSSPTNTTLYCSIPYTTIIFDSSLLLVLASAYLKVDPAISATRTSPIYLHRNKTSCWKAVGLREATSSHIHKRNECSATMCTVKLHSVWVCFEHFTTKPKVFLSHGPWPPWLPFLPMAPRPQSSRLRVASFWALADGRKRGRRRRSVRGGLLDVTIGQKGFTMKL